MHGRNAIPQLLEGFLCLENILKGVFLNGKLAPCNMKSTNLPTPTPPKKYNNNNNNKNNNNNNDNNNSITIYNYNKNVPRILCNWRRLGRKWSDFLVT